MKKITTILMLLVLMCAGAWAQNETVVTYGSNGTFYNTSNSAVTSGGFLAIKFVSNTTPAVTVMADDGHPEALHTTDGRIGINDSPTTLTISVPDGYEIVGYQFEAKAVNNSHPAKTFTPKGGEGITIPADQTWRTYKAENVNAQSTYFTLTSTAWSPINSRNFKITVKELPLQNAAQVTFVVVNAAGNTLASQVVEKEVGTVITDLPADMKRDFTTYTSTPMTVTEGGENVFTATATFNTPFEISTDFDNAKWYYLNLKGGTGFPTYVAEGNPNVTLPGSNAENDNTSWAFVGDTYNGFTIYNKAAGGSVVLGSDIADGNGGSTYATLNQPDTKTREIWTIEASSHYTNGFFIRNADNHALNLRSNANLAYWTGGADAGSTFVATKVPGLADFLAEAQALLTNLTNGANSVQIGYPTATALSAFSTAITAAGNGELDIDGLRAAMTAVTAVENTVYTPRTDVYYTITSGRGSMIYHPEYVVTGKEGISFLFHTGSTKNSGALNVTLDKDNANHQWGFIEKDGKYYMYNVGKKQFANVTQNGTYQNSNGDRHTWMFSDAPSAVTLDAGEGNWVATPNVRVRATSEVTGKQYAMSISQSYDGPVIAYDAVNDGGIPMTFAVATTTQDTDVTDAIVALLEDLTPYRDALQAAIAAANATIANVGEGVNKYTVTDGQTALETALAAAVAELAKEDSQTSKEALTAAREAIETALAGLTKTLNMPQPGFYRIKGKTSGKYVSNGGGNGSKYTMAENVDETTIFCYDGTKLVNFKTGLCFSVQDWTWKYGNENPVTVAFIDGQSNGGYAIQNGTGSGQPIHLYDDNQGTCDRGSFDPATITNQSERYRNWQLEEVAELPITLKQVGDKFYATFSAPVDIASIAGAEMYDVEVNADNKTASTKAVNGNGLKAGNGVVLIGASGEATATIGSADETATTNLKPQYASEEAAAHNNAGHFFLGTKKNSEDVSVIGFYKLKSEGGKTGGFKAYIEKNVTGSEAKEGFDLIGNEVTGIETIENGTFDNGAVYNLQGQKVTKAQKGVYIINNKKVVVK